MVWMVAQIVGWLAIGIVWGRLWAARQIVKRDEALAAARLSQAKALIQEAKDHLADARTVVEERTQAPVVH